MKKIAAFIITFGFIWCSPLRGLDPGRAVTQYVHREWTVEDGLPNSMINAILQTGDGYLWIGTNDGLVRFDGVTFVTFNRDNTGAVPDNRVTSLMESRDKALWIGTRGGLLVYRNGSFTSRTEKNGLLKPVVMSLLEDGDGNVWVGYRGKTGLSLFLKGRFSEDASLRHFKENDLTDGEIKSVNDFCLDEDGTVWLAAVGGLFRLREGKAVKVDIRTGNGEPVRAFLSLFAGKNGCIWAATAKNGLLRYNRANRKTTFFGRRNGLKTGFINHIYIDRDGCAWISSEGFGLYRLLPDDISSSGTETTSVLTKKDGLPDNSVYYVCEDREGNLWVGTYSGLSQIRNGKVIGFTEREGLLDNGTWTIYRDRDDALWISTNKGLNRLRNGEFTAYRARDGLSSDFVSTTWQDGRGTLWIGTYDKGLNRMTGGRFYRVGEERGFVANSVRLVYEDSGGNLWIGTYGKGLFVKYAVNPPDFAAKAPAGWFVQFPDPVNEKSVEPEKKISSVHIFSLYEDRNGSIWLGTDGGGLNRIDGDRVTVYNTKNGLSSDTITAIMEDKEKKNSLWIGTEDNGLSYLETATGDRGTVTVKNGLADNSVNAIVEDGYGYFWLSGNKGITRVSKKLLYDFLAGKIPSVSVMLLGKGDGMRSQACNGTFQPSAWKDKDGTIWFPTTGGVVRVDPGNLNLNSVKPPVSIEKVLVDGYAVKPGEGLVLESGIKKIEIHYTAISLSDPRRMEFKTMLDGFDRHWESTGDRKDRIATYTSIPPGDYTFRVIASNNDGIWNKKGAFLKISVKPPFWMRWWFLLVAAAGFAFLSYTGITYLKRLAAVIRFWKKKNYVGAYKIIDQIGTGGMATIYKAVTGSGLKKRTVALKLMKDEYTFDEIYRKRFLTEGRIIDNIEHPHIVKIFDRGEHNRRLFIAMELLQGETLDRLIVENAPLPVSQCLEIAEQTLEALAEIHRAGIIHRDMKPGNIFIETRNGRRFVKILDFGLAKSEAVSRVTETGMVVGTLSYLSPEQLLNSKYSTASDIYAFGVILYEMLTAKKPYRGETALERIQAILKEPLKEPKFFNENIPDKLNVLITNMMAKEPEARPNAEVLIIAMKKIALLIR